jgi:Na+/H+ antiporter NhaD/arsenite permease-like protein
METIATPNPWIILPFGLLLAVIALAPLFFAGWWGKHYPKAAFALGAVTLLYYFVELKAYHRVYESFEEYISFIALVGSLYVVSGGVHIRVKGESTPLANVIFLGLGAVLANLFGTTGASMLMIRPWLKMNRYRVTGYHVVFFIFIISNVGGCLTPIGDPPLFLGYLQGIPFWWVAEHCWPMWLVANLLLLAFFYIWDVKNYRRASSETRRTVAEPPDTWKFEGLPNLFFLAVILGAVFIEKPHFLREGLMFAAAIGSFLTTKKAVHQANAFDFHPIKEVAILFAAIFATMIPALDWIKSNARELGTPTPSFYYVSCGALSSVLDNAPTYLSFLSATEGAFIDTNTVRQVEHAIKSGAGKADAEISGPNAESIRNTLDALRKYHPQEFAKGEVTISQIETAFLLGNQQLNAFILAISVGAVFFGANTYIGNGPNFMVKSIAEAGKVRHVPSFLGYVFKFTLPVMGPVLFIIWLLFFRG